MSSAPCKTCERDPARMNSQIAECSHVDCPHRRHAWSERPTRAELFKGPWPRSDSGDPLPLDKVRTNWPAGLLAAALFLGLLAQVAKLSDSDPERDLTTETREMAQRIEATQRRMDRAARELCRKVAGPDAVPVERIGGEIGCMPRGAL